MKKVWFDEMTWKEAEEAFKKTDIAVICCGATHPHGMACPLGTDTFVARGLGERIGKKSNAIVVPTIPFGQNKYHMDFPGCINITNQHLCDYYMDICESLVKWGIRKFVWVSPHGGNKQSIEDVAYRLRYDKGVLSASVAYQVARQLNPELGKYGGSEGLVDETSMMLYLRPDTAHPDRAEFKEYKQIFGPKAKVAAFKSIKFGEAKVPIFTTSKDVSDTCGFGPPESIDMANATKELGERIIETAANYIVEFIEAFGDVEIPPTY